MTAATEQLVYADASALVKLAIDEPESEELGRFVTDTRPLLASSALAVVELLRAVRIADRTGVGIARARVRLEEMLLVDVDRDLLDDAVTYTSAHVRSLDAIHLASAVRIGARRMLVYDRRLAEAAEAAGIEVLHPGA